MLRQIFSAALALSGGIIMAMATRKYRALLRLNLEEAYETKGSTHAEKAALAMMYFFIVGYCVGMMDALLRDIEPIYVFVIVVFFLGAVFIYFSISAQMSMASRLREKTHETMMALINAIEMKDSYTKGHSHHVYEIVELIYENLGDDYKHRISKPKLMDAALLHDIGKISVSDDVLKKAGALNEGDWQKMKTHPASGKRMIDDTCFCAVSEWVLYHHERLDGRGYYGIMGEEIPIEARIISVADTYSALCTDRVYRTKMSHEKALEIMTEVSGTQLDPTLINVFRTIDEARLTEITASITH